MRITAPAVLALFLLMSADSNVQAQACGASFVDIIVVDSNGKSIPKVTAELIALGLDNYPERLWPKKGNLVLSPNNGPIVKVPTQDAEEIIKLTKPSKMKTDFCGNPLKIVADSTKITVPFAFGSITNFGFCTTELDRTPWLLRISAPRYVTDYYVGPVLGGCRKTYKIILAKE